SWDCYGAAVNEEQVRSKADFKARTVKKYGWEYIIVDIQWYEPFAESHEYRANAELITDEYGRLMPAENRFPSANNGRGFKPLADYVHSLGLKFGIHILRGTPKQAVRRNTPIFSSPHTAAEIADFGSVCGWNGDMCGIDMSRAGAQDYYDSIFKLYAEWGVDFVKVDDIARPYHKAEVEGIKMAIESSGRNMVLSLSPGESPVSEAEHLCAHANMWRMSDDFWDDWAQLRRMFDYCRDWFPYTGNGHFPDCDMIPLGNLRLCNGSGGDKSRFTRDEQKTLMSLWCIFRSPLFFGGDLPTTDADTIALLQNTELIKLNQQGFAPREVMRRGNAVVWASEGADGKYIAQFNVGEADEIITTELAYLGITSASTVTATELWDGTTAKIKEKITSAVPPHGVKIYKLTSKEI
ncbi:MAG: glycoside hydrolase family 27 protein, partial [Firmicutes bacterium]|nr:glycoside hydrolase family 27 protein [Bacillota bacterium]